MVSDTVVDAPSPSPPSGTGDASGVPRDTPTAGSGGPQLVVVGLDLSLTCSGWARAAGASIEFGTLKPGAKRSGPERLAWVCDRVSELVGEPSPAHAPVVVLEGYSFGSQGRATFSIGELGGAVRMTLFRLGVPFVEVPPAVLKKFATGSGQASKDVVLLAAARRGGERFTGSSNDEADAFWLLVAGVQAAVQRGAALSPLLQMPAAHIEALGQVDWTPLEDTVALLGSNLT